MIGGLEMRIPGLLVVALMLGLALGTQKDRFLVNAEGSLSPVEWGPGERVSQDALLEMEFGDLVIMKEGKVLVLEHETPDGTSLGFRDLQSGNVDLVSFSRAELLRKGSRVVKRSDREDYNNAVGNYVRNGYRGEVP